MNGHYYIRLRYYSEDTEMVETEILYIGHDIVETESKFLELADSYTETFVPRGYHVEMDTPARELVLLTKKPDFIELVLCYHSN